MNVVPHAGPVGRGESGAEDRDAVAQPGGRFARGIHQTRTAPSRRARAQRRIGAGDIEQAQRHVPEFMPVHRVSQRAFRRRLGNAVGRERRERRILPHRHPPRHAVHRRRRRKHHVPHAAIDHRTDQPRRRHAVDAMVLPRLRERLRNPHARGQMHDRSDRVFLQGRSQRLPIADIGPNEGDDAPPAELAEALAQLRRGVAKHPVVVMQYRPEPGDTAAHIDRMGAMEEV